MSMQRDLLGPVIQPIDKTVGTSNGKSLGHIANGETAEQLRARWQAGELPGLNPEYAKQWLAL